MARDEVAPFTVTLFIDKSTLARPVSDETATNLWVYFDIFPKVTWVIICLTILVIGVGFVVIKVAGINHSEDSEEMNIFNAMGLSALPTEVELAPYNINMNCLSPRQRPYFSSK